MILVMLGTSLLVSLFMGLTRVKTMGLMLFGGSIAIIMNTLRIMLMTIASVY
jgi:hypothetical protein